MAFLLGDKQLRDRPEKPKKKPPLTNAEKCKARRERRKQDAALVEIDKAKKKESNHLYYGALTSEQRAQRKLSNTIKQRERRQKLKEQLADSVSVSPKTSTPKKSKSKTPKPNSYCTRTITLQTMEKKERNRLSQQKRRKNMHPQKKQKELRKKRERYHLQKEEKQTSRIGKVRGLAKTLLTMKTHLKTARSKMSLWKLQFVKSLLSRKESTKNLKEISSFYKRPARSSETVEKFLEKAAIDYPGQKGSSKQKKVLTKTMEALLMDFKASYPGVKMSLTTFKRRRPNNILLSSSRKFEQCLCETCTNANLMIKALNRCVKDKEDKLPQVESVVIQTLCNPKHRSCLDRVCSHCGVDTVIDSIKERVGVAVEDKEVKWWKWEKTEASRKDLVEKSGPLSEIVRLFAERLRDIGKHIVVAQWQRMRYHSLKENLPRGHAILTVDFAENYLCKFQDEVQSAHWSYKQVSVHPCVFFYRCPEPTCFKTETEYLVFLSDELRHDSDFTKHIFSDCIQRMQAKGISVLHIFSDGCSSQYKSRFTLQNLADLQKTHPNIKITRHFFGSSHGKSMCDSYGGVVKNMCAKAVVSGAKIIQSAKAMHDFCSETLTVLGPIECELHTKSSLSSFVLVEPGDIPRKERPVVLPIKGVRAVHSVKFSSQGDIYVRDLSCICNVCLLGEDEICSNYDFSGPWKRTPINCQKNDNRGYKMKTRPAKRKKPNIFNEPSQPPSDTSVNGDPSYAPSQPPSDTSVNGDPSYAPSQPPSDTSVNGDPSYAPSQPPSDTSVNGDPSYAPSQPPSDTSVNGDPSYAPSQFLSVNGDPSYGPSTPPSDTSVNGDPSHVPSDTSVYNESLIFDAHYIEHLDLVPLPIAHSRSRYAFFALLQKQMSKCVDFNDLRMLVKRASLDVIKYPMPIVTPKCVIDLGIVDAIAKDLVPQFLHPLFPVLTVADGNCVPRSLSLVCFGDQDHHIEMRCRIVMELTSHSFDYLCLDSSDLHFLQVLSDSYTSDLQKTFQDETLKIARNSVYMGMWQFMAATNVIGTSIFSVYPHLGSTAYRKFFTRRLKPRNATSSHTVALLWSATLEHSNNMPKHNWTANHVVPLMGLTQIVEVACDDIL